MNAAFAIFAQIDIEKAVVALVIEANINKVCTIFGARILCVVNNTCSYYLL